MSDKYFGSSMPWILFVAPTLAFLIYALKKYANLEWGAIGAIATVLTLISGLGWYLIQDYNTKRLHHQHVKPDVSCSMEYPIKVENEKIFRNKRNPDIILKNNGPIKAVSVSCNIMIYIYDAKKSLIAYASEWKFKGFDHTFSAQELEPFAEIRQSVMGDNTENTIAVYSVTAKYHRESDMETFSFETYFFTENQEIKTDQEFKKDARYNQVIEKVKAFVPSESNDQKFEVTAAADHTWFFESDPSSKVKKNADGSITVAMPKEQSKIPQDGYPFLVITPKRFSATGFYTEATIIEDHIEVKIPFEIKNIGNSTAIITQDGFESITKIEPNQNKTHIKPILVGRGKDNKESLEHFIEMINTQDKIFQLKFYILYRPSNHMDELFKMTVHYEIGKNKVTPVSENSNNP